MSKKAKPTRYRERDYRSKTEAKTAALMLLFGGSYTYERDCFLISETRGYRPDFKLRNVYIIKHGITRDVFVEAKGGLLDDDCANKVSSIYGASKSNGAWDFPVLIVGWPLPTKSLEYSGDDEEDWKRLKAYVTACYHDFQCYSDSIGYFNFASIDGECAPALLCVPKNKGACVAICRVGTADEDAVDITSTMAAHRGLLDEVKTFVACDAPLFETALETVSGLEFRRGVHSFTVVDVMICRREIGPAAPPEYVKVLLQITDIEPPVVISTFFDGHSTWDDQPCGCAALLKSVGASKRGWVDNIVGLGGEAYMAVSDDGRVDICRYLPLERQPDSDDYSAPMAREPRNTYDAGNCTTQEPAPAIDEQARCGSYNPSGVTEANARAICAIATLTGMSEDAVVSKLVNDGILKIVAEMNLPF